MEALEQSFFDRAPHDVARDLLGRRLIKRSAPESLEATIIETEVYGGTRDAASHADTGKPTDRTRPMFGPPGTAYVYKIYGIHHCFNIVTPEGVRPSAVLIRALYPENGIARMADRRDIDLDSSAPNRSKLKKLLSGPGKLCQAFDISTALNGEDVASPPLYISLDRESPSTIETSPRIGLNPETVGEAAEWKWRYTLEDYDYYLSR